MLRRSQHARKKARLLETADFEKALSGMAAKEVNARWQREMAGYFEGPTGRHADEQMTPLEEIFHLD